MPRFPVRADAIDGERISLSGPDVRHVRSVLRLGLGDLLDCSLPNGRWARAEIVATEENAIEARIRGQWASLADPVMELLVAQGLVKGDAMDRIVKGLSEIGTAELVPVITARSIGVPPADRRDARVARWRRIADESCKQCGRTVPLRVAPIATLASWLASEPFRGMPGLVLSPAATASPVRDVIPGGCGLVLAIGPEGGFTIDEEQALQGAGAVPASLGPRILRCETAALVSAALALEALGALCAPPDRH